MAEALGIAVLMDGGTASVYTPRAWEAFLEFAHSEEVGRLTDHAVAGS